MDVDTEPVMALERLTPRPFQREGVGLIEAYGGRVILADEMGLGKTPQALWFLRRNRQALPAVVVCTKSTKAQWCRMATRNFGFRSESLESLKPHRGTFGHMSELYVINYDILYKWWQWLAERGVRTVIADECQHFSNRETRRTVAGRHLCQTAKFVIGLSGTPLMNRPWELWPMLNMCRPDLYNSAWSYGTKYCQPRYERGEWTFKGATNVPELHQELRDNKVLIRRLKVNVLKDLPPRTRSVVPVELHHPERYAHAANDFVGWLKTISPAKARTAAKAVAVTRMNYLLELAGREKVRAVVAWVDHFLEETEESKDKIVLFAYHRAMVATLHRRYGAGSVYVMGDVNGRKRDEAVQRFVKDPTCRVFIGNQAALAGVDGLQVAQDLAFTQFFWRPADHTQGEARIDRMGQTGGAMRFHYLTAVGTIEEDMCEIIQRKQGIVTGVLDGAEAKADTLEIYDLLLERMLQRRAA